MTDETKRLLVPEVAAEIRASERFVKDEIRRKNLRAIKLGAKWVVERADLERYVAAHANVSPVKRAAS